MEKLAEFIRKHPWWQWLTRTPAAAKMTKYALSSVLAFVLSYVTFTLGYVLTGLTTIPSIIAFLIAAVVNWTMNRRWAWKQTGKAPVKETVAYAAVSLATLGITALATGRTNYWVKHIAHIQNHHGLRLLIVTGAYVVINVVLFVAKFLVYEYVIFASERGHRRGHQRTDDDDRRDDDEPRAGGGRFLRTDEREPALSSGPAA
jgi:putative flippase GtrA